MRRTVAWAALGLTLTACHPGTGEAVVPAGAGRLPTDAVLWAVGDTIHVGERTIRVGRPVRAMVEANGRIYFVQGRSDVVRVTDGVESRSTGLRADELAVSQDGRYLGMLEVSDDPWSTVVVDLESGEVVVRDDAGMGGDGDDYTDLYEDAQPHVLGFDGDELYVQTASGNDVMSWDAPTGERTEHVDAYFFARRDPSGQVLPALVRRGRLVVPKDPYRSTQWGRLSPDGSVAVMPADGGSQVFDVASGRRLPVELPGRKLLVGGWTDTQTAYGLAFDRSPFGPHRVRLVTCRLSVEQQRCEVLRTIQLPPHQLVLFPTGTSATDH